MKVISAFIAPWALSKEMIPFHIVWESETIYDLIRVILPSNFKVHEFFNVDEFSIDGTVTLIKKLKTKNYFGVVVYSDEVYEFPVAKKEIIVEFLSQGEVKHTQSFMAHIIRPVLTVLNAPKTIILNEDIDPKNLINVSLKYLGLGTAKIRVEASHKGEMVSQTEPLFHYIMKKMIDQKILADARKEEEPQKSEAVDIDPVAVAKLTEEVIERIKKGVVPPELNRESLVEFQQWMSNPVNAERLMKFVYTEIEQLMVSAFLYCFERHPSESVELTDGVTNTVFRHKIKEIDMMIRYTDSLDNEYKPLEVTIQVDDQRKNTDRMLAAPVNLSFTTERVDLEA